MYELHWKTTDIRAGKLIAVTVPATFAYAATPIKFATPQDAKRWAEDNFKTWRERFPYTVKQVSPQ